MKFSLQTARWVGVASLLASNFTSAAPSYARHANSLALRDTNSTSPSNSTSSDRLVFCHFMIGIVGERTSTADYDGDMQRAKSLGIDAFALNIGVDPYTDAQLKLAYDSAAKNDMKVFISFDFNWYHVGQASEVGAMIAKYGKEPAQLMVDGKVFASSFAGDGLDVKAMKAAAGLDVFWAPNFHPEQTTDASAIDGALNWMAWPNDGLNKAPKAGRNVTVQAGDEAYQKWLGSKPYIAPVSAWFSTHFGPEVSYSKNWVFPSDLLWYDRWNEVLTMGPRFIEIVTWNDYGESHYIGPLDSLHYDDGNSKWVNDMPHDGWLDMAKPFIAAFHAGATKVDDYIKEDEIIYWYRPTLKTLDCDATDTTMVTASNTSGNYFMGRPDGSETFKDSVFVVSLLTSAGSITVTSGNNSKTYDAPAGAFAYEVDMAVGKQSFELTRDKQSVLKGTSLKEVSHVCICGIYNFNAYVGSLPEKSFGSLNKDGLASLTAGLHVSTCSPTPSINGGGGNGTAPAPTGGSGGGSAPSSQAAVTTTAATTSTAASAGSSAEVPSTTVTPTATSDAGSGAGGAGGAASSTETAAQPTGTSTGGGGTDSGTGSGTGSGTCSAGTAGSGMSGNFLGLCQFTCARGYCPAGVCQCTANGTPQAAEASDASIKGCPAPGLSDGYLGLCNFACSRGYCPETACTTNC
ncbi:hypothetical protein GQ53DRAFT_790436 [Thozetella sp. PMI_491]|nr:hypothetical protein GQ53DRAFT_790436 [Thozetella sp. PMI_491]